MREMAWFILIIFVLLTIVLILSGLKQVGEKERVAVELFGKFFKILTPGLNWIFPGIMQMKEKVFVQELSISLFESPLGSPIKIDFSDGWAIPNNAEAFVKMKSPDIPYSVDGDEPRSGAYRAIYEIKDWKKAIQDRLDNAVRTYLNRLTVDEAITMGKAGFNLANRDPDIGLPNPELEEIEKALERWGWQLKIVTVGDFDLDPKIIEARSKVHREKKASEAASFVVQRQSKEWVGMIVEAMAQTRGKTVEEIQKEIDSSPKLKKEFLQYAKMINLRLEEAERNAVVHVVVDGSGEGKESNGFLDDIEKRVIRVLAARERMPKGKPNPAEEVKEMNEKKSEKVIKETEEEKKEELTGAQKGIIKEAERRGIDPRKPLERWHQWEEKRDRKKSNKKN